MPARCAHRGDSVACSGSIASEGSGPSTSLARPGIYTALADSDSSETTEVPVFPALTCVEFALIWTQTQEHSP
jgi:hypothetical protein